MSDRRQPPVISHLLVHDLVAISAEKQALIGLCRKHNLRVAPLLAPELLTRKQLHVKTHGYCA